jgi:predicted GNAT family N-acyltransferase
MLSVSFKIIAHDSPFYQEAVTLRENILRKPLGLLISHDELKMEKKHIPIVGLWKDEVLATALLVPENTTCKMRQVAVKTTYQNQGIGSQLMHFCEEYARSLGFDTLYCHARNSAVPFYLNNQFISEGEYFDEDTLPHLKMVKRI